MAGNCGSLSLAALAVLIFSPLPLSVQLLYGLVLAVLVVQSVLGRNNSLPKEFLCGYLFALGCGLSVRYMSLDSYAGPFSPETLLLALLFALNCVAISCYERKTDRSFDPGAIFQIWPGIARAYPLLLPSLAALSVFAISQTLRHPKSWPLAARCFSAPCCWVRCICSPGASLRTWPVCWRTRL